MSSPDSAGSPSSLSSDTTTPSRRPSASRHVSRPSRRSDLDISPDQSRRELPRRPSSSAHRPGHEPGQHGCRPPHAPFLAPDHSNGRRGLNGPDRKRRLTSSAQEAGRRRTNSGHFHDRAGPRHVAILDGPSSPPRSDTHPRSAPEIVDLTGSSPPPPPPQPQPSSTRTAALSPTAAGDPRRYVVPPWQPDSAAAECPICHRPFTWMFRRHHCRKCGRVVCNDCSPHRITIPRQFIVHPPGPDDAFAASSSSSADRRGTSVDLTGPGSPDTPSHVSLLSHRHRGVAPLDGGEKVRLCNPCVPDPQPDPPPNYPPLLAGLATRDEEVRGPRASTAYTNATNPTRSSVVSIPGESNLRSPRDTAHPQPHQHMAAAMEAGMANETRLRSPTSWGLRWSTPPNQPLSPDRRTNAGPQQISLSSSASPSPVGPASPRLPHGSTRSPTTRSMFGFPAGTFFARDQTPRDELPSSSSWRRPTGRTPPRPTGSASWHVSARHSPPAPTARPRVHERDLCPVCRHALPPRGLDGDETAREAHIMDCIRARDPSYQGDGDGAGPSQARIHMLAFVATEKDCVAEDGIAQECSICMVEYDVGDELARLECLCKFHKLCIVEWLRRKSECPVHKLIT